MNNVFSFETKRVEVLAATIRARLVDLRKVKLSGRDIATVAPDPSLDQALQTMSVLRDQLADEVDTVSADAVGDGRAILVWREPSLPTPRKRWICCFGSAPSQRWRASRCRQ